jgi:hypothetical protein
MKQFPPAKFTAMITAVTAVAVIAAATVAGATMTATAALASSTTVHHSISKHQKGRARATAGRVVSESQDESGTYLTVVRCSGKTAPAPVVITSADPFTVKGTIATKAVTNALAERPRGYAPVYTCTVTVLRKLPACPSGQILVKGMTRRSSCMTPLDELAWFVSQAASASGPKSRACVTARKLAGKGDRTARKAERFSCSARLVLNTGFGGMARKVSHHHPRK